TTLNNLAALYEAQGRYAQAEELYHRSLAIREQLLGPDHPEVAIMLNNLAGLYRATGLGEKAESLYDRSLAVMEKIFGPRHPNTAIVRANRDAYKHTAPNKANSADAKKRRG
ncbi:tetratricopeptide repeat protein, partial [Nitrosococcus oceani]